MKCEIEIEGLPEGWEPVAYRTPKRHEKYYKDGTIRCAAVDLQWPEMVIKKKQPRRIVLEETEERNVFNKSGELKRQEFASGLIIYDQHKIWRIVGDTGERDDS